MTKKIKVGILKETKIPPDRRVAIAPLQGLDFIKNFPEIDICFQKSDIRAYNNEEYTKLGLSLQDDMSDCDFLIGVKEVALDKLIANKTYMFFSHTAKKQPHNKALLQEILKKHITLVDYEELTNSEGQRLVAFGRWAGIVGAYNGLLAYGKRSGAYKLKRAYECFDMEEFFNEVRKVKLPALKILITGSGRVAHGAMETLAPLDLQKVSPHDFLNKTFDVPVYTQIDPWHYAKRKDGESFDLKHFFKHPDEYQSTFLPYTQVTDIYIACHFWDPRSPVFMTAADMKAPDFKMKIIADISCDIKIPIPSTVRASTIAEPFYGYNVITENEADPFDENNITVMAVDNLPGEAPRNASIDFGSQLITKIFPSLLLNDSENIIERATIAKDGKLTEKFSYLQNWVDNKE